MRNESERGFKELMESGDWTVTKKGWPDFACYKKGKLVCIEVKRKRGYRLKKEQLKLMIELVKHGVKCYRWSPDGGFEPVLTSVEFPIDLP